MKNTQHKTEDIAATKELVIQTNNETPVEFIPKTRFEIAAAKVCDEIVKLTVKTTVLYIDLCKNIREGQIPPPLVRLMMSEKGFHKSRISNVNTVANMPNDLWNQAMAAQIGFVKVLDMARGSTIEQAVSDLVGDEFKEDHQRLLVEGEEAKEGGSDETPAPTKTARERIKILCASAARLAEKNELRKLTYKFTDLEYTVTISRYAKTGGKAAKPE